MENKEYQDLFTYLRKIRLDEDLKCNNSNITGSLKKDFKDVKDVLHNIKGFVKNSIHSYESKQEKIEKNIKDFESKNIDVINEDKVQETIASLFKDDKFGYQKVLLGLAVATDNEYEYFYEDEGLKKVSKILFNDEKKLVSLNEDFKENFKRICSPSLTDKQKQALFVSALSALTVFTLTGTPVIASSVLTGNILGAAIFGLNPILINTGLTTLLVRNCMKEYNKTKVRAVINDCSLEDLESRLALNVTLIRYLKTSFNHEEIKEELDQRLKTLDDVKSELDYLAYIEKINVEKNKEKIEAFHRYDKQLARTF